MGFGQCLIAVNCYAATNPWWSLWSALGLCKTCKALIICSNLIAPFEFHTKRFGTFTMYMYYLLTAQTLTKLWSVGLYCVIFVSCIGLVTGILLAVYRYMFGKSYVQKSVTDFGERQHSINHVSWNLRYCVSSETLIQVSEILSGQSIDVKISLQAMKPYREYDIT